MKNNFIKTTLKNGVQLYLYKDNKMKKTLVDYGVNYGSSGIYYDFYLDGEHYHVLPGCAHFLEHLLGEHSKYGNLYKKLAQKKYRANAATGDNYTHYYFIGVDNIYESIKELITAIDDPVFTEDDINKTSEAICEETKMVRDNKYKTAIAICKRNLYSNMSLIPECLNRIGDENTTKALDYKTLKACYNAYYNDENKYLIIAGNINEKEIINYIESIYDELPSHPNRKKDYVYGKNEIVRNEKQIEYMPTSDDLIMIGFKEKLKKFSKKEIIYFISFILETKFENDSKFVEKMKKATLLSKVEVFNISFLSNEYNFLLGFSTSNSEKLIENVKKEIAINDFNEKDFELFKKYKIAIQASRIDNKYNSILNFSFRKMYTENFDDIDFIKQLTFDRFLEFYNQLDFSKNTIVVIKNPK